MATQNNPNMSDYEEQMFNSDLYSTPILNYDDINASFLMRQLMEDHNQDDQEDDLNS